MFHQRLISLCMATLLAAWGTGCTINNCEEGAICLDEDGDDVLYECVRLCQHLVDCGQLEQGERGACIDSCEQAAVHAEDSLEDYCECAAESSCRDLSRACGQPPFPLPPAGRGDDDDQDPPPPPRDAGRPGDTGVDAGSTIDASVDAGRAVDASVDAGRRRDASVEAGPVSDAGNVDASADAGSDASAGGDGGTTADAGSDAGPTPHTDAASGACTCDEDCAATEGCVQGTCRARCSASCECRRGDVCEQGFCVAPPPVSMSCQNDCECPSGQRCVASICTAPDSPPLL